MATHWAIDLGTSNTTICEDRSGSPRVVNLPDLSVDEPITQTPLIPSALCILDDRAGTVLIGEKAVAYNWDGRAPGFVASFKPYLGAESHRPLARVGRRTIMAKDAAALYLGEILRALEAQLGETVRDVTIATPAGAFETYRAELNRIVDAIDRSTLWRRLMGWLGVGPPSTVFRTIDEPVAAALGYGVDVGRRTTLVAFDFGAGSMEAAAIRTGSGQATSGRADVLAKQAAALGGNDVDGWILEKLVPRWLHDWPEWEVALRWEAERVKLLASAGAEGVFTFRNETFGKLDHPALRAILTEKGIYERVRTMLQNLLDELRVRHGVRPGDIEDVILEGGSTLLPDVRTVVGEVLGREKVREWLPFEAVARGACIFAAGTKVEDFVYHDYALRVMPDGEASAEYELLIPSGTHYPTPKDFVTRYYAAGFDGQESINLFICEVGRVAGGRVAWRARDNGTHSFAPRTAGERAFCICLNEADPALPLEPPGRGHGPRLRVTYSVNENRWLCATVHDLQRKVDLHVERPVVRLR